MRRVPFGLAFILLSTSMVPALAAHCEAPYDARPEITQAPFYVDTWYCQLECEQTWDVVVYEESNGLPGLQRGDGFEDGTCHGMIPPDRLLFHDDWLTSMI